MTPTLPAAALAGLLASLAAAPLLAQEAAPDAAEAPAAAEPAAEPAPAAEAAAPAEDAAPAEEPAATATQEAPAEAPAEEAAAADPVAIPDMTLGAEDAPVEIVEYGSFTCPHCANWHEEVWPQLKADYIDQGLVRFTFREVYFDRFGLWASMIARCGGEMRFFGLHDQLYETQREWIGDGDPATIAANLRAMGRSAGLSDATLEACLSDEPQARGLIAWYEANAEADSIASTPTFLINGEAHSGEMPWEDFKALVDAELPQAQE